MIDFIKRCWRVLRRPATHYSLGFLTIGGFIGGALFWGGFNTALEMTNTEEFRIGCHEMRDNVYQELQGTIHFTKRSGVRAKCSDCHAGIAHRLPDLSGLPRAAASHGGQKAIPAIISGGGDALPPAPAQ